MRAEKLVILFCVCTWALCLAIMFVQPYFEAKTFNKFSKTKATYWDALVSDLRVVPDK